MRIGLAALSLVLAAGANATVGTCESLPGGVIEAEGTGGSASQPTGYPTLQAAFAAINLGAHTGGTVSIDVCGNTAELGSAVLNASGGTATYATISMQPVGGTRTISGSIAGALIDLNGADAVTIDGLNSGNRLTIENANTGLAASTILFRADASNNTVRNCTIRGGETGTASGTISFTTGTTTGNIGNVIAGNTITSSGANLPVNAIYSAGTSDAIANTASVTGNNIQDYFHAFRASSGIFLASNSAGWTITANKFFQTGMRIATDSVLHHAIDIVTPNGGGFTINSNVIGYASAAATGWTQYMHNVANIQFAGIEVTAANAPKSEIQGNIVTAISITTAGNENTAPGIFVGSPGTELEFAL